MANSQSFLKELCQLLELPEPEPTESDESQNNYVFEKTLNFNNGDGTFSAGRVDLYRQKAFVLESKQGAERRANELAEELATVTKQQKHRKGTAQRGSAQWAQAMRSAYHQAKRYAEALPEWPPFLIVCDVGYCFDVYSDFSGSGKNYSQFPDPQTSRIPLQNLTKPETQEFLKAVWQDPHSLDPSKKSAKVTRELADRLAKLAKSLETASTETKDERAHRVAQFLMRCLFTMFAEDVELIPKGSFAELLESLRNTPENFGPMMEALWRDMDKGGFSPILRQKILQFNGGLFADRAALPLNRDQLELLIEAAKSNWAEVEPAIFGTLLERALDPVERHKLGAHYTPRAYVERLVLPTLIEPLRNEWETAYATAAQLFAEASRVVELAQDHKSDQKRVDANKAATRMRDEARKVIRDFHQNLCEIRVLDPACGSGNFLYVALELMKKLEAEVIRAMRDFGDSGTILATIDPHQFLGIEINPRAAAIADLVLWIGYLQWHIRALGRESISEPIIRKFDNIECRDAVLAWDSIQPVFDDDGKAVTRWDGRTTKRHPATGDEVPDETARVQELRYINPRNADWPLVDFIIGNPPFIGNKRMRFALGDGYVNALRDAHAQVPESADFVMYWWQTSATKLHEHSATRFGFITTNSITQEFNRRVIEAAMNPIGKLSLIRAIQNHPWVDSADGAAVRISMTVAQAGKLDGLLSTVVSEAETPDSAPMLKDAFGHIHPDLTIGADLTSVESLTSNRTLSNRGVIPHGQGLVIDQEIAVSLGLGRVPGLQNHIREYRNGKDLAQRNRGKLVIDLLGIPIAKVKTEFPEVYQWILERVKPERDQNNRKSVRERWWIFAEPRKVMRAVHKDLDRFIATGQVNKHRFFSFLPAEVLPDDKVIAIGLRDSALHSVLSSRIHCVWALHTGGRLGVGNDPVYNKSTCFDCFPFPILKDDTKPRLEQLGERLDAHRKRQQELHSDLTMTGMYNVLEKLSSGEELTAKEKQIHEKGLVSVLKQIHDELDAAVFDAYGWPHDLTDQEILERLVALNHERAEEEKNGLIRWLRPEFQNPSGGKSSVQPELELEGDSEDEDETEEPTGKAGAKKKPAKAATKADWPKKLPEQVATVRQSLQDNKGPTTSEAIAKRFKSVKADTVEELLDTLVLIGQARLLPDGRYVA